MTNEEARAAINATVDNGVRWTRNILTELLSNYGMSISKERREHLRKAISHLSDLDLAPKQDKEGNRP